eukprot:4057483-Amphidinium_carterae.1
MDHAVTVVIHNTNDVESDATQTFMRGFGYRSQESSSRCTELISWSETVRLPVSAEELADTGIVGLVFSEAPFQLRPHLRVMRHTAFLQCLECVRQTGK